MRLLAILFFSLTAVRAADLASSVALMAKIGFCSSPSFSPDGKRVAFVSNMTGIPQIWTVPTSGGWPTLVTALDDPIGFVTWSPNSDLLAFSLAPGGGMNAQIYLIKPDGSGMRRITDGGKETNGLGGWTHDGKMLMMGSNRKDPSKIAGYVYDVEQSKMILGSEKPGAVSITDVSRDNMHVVMSHLASRGDNNLYLRELFNGTEALLTPHEGTGSFGGGRFSPDGSLVYLTSDKDRDLEAFARIKISGEGKPGAIETIAARSDAQVDGFELSEDGTTAALVWNVDGRSELDFVDLASLKITHGPKLRSEIISGAKFSRDGRMLAITAGGSSAPFDIWIFDRTTGKLAQLSQSPHAGVSLDTLVSPRLVKFPAHDGLELSGWLYQPKDSKAPGPMVLDYHGGPEGQSRPGFNSTYQALLGQGIAVFSPNVRGSSGFGKKFVNLDNGALRVNGVKDIQAFVNYVVKSGAADPKRIGIMGGSYGGYMTMAGLTEYPDLFAAGADLFGVVNFETFFAHTEPWMAAISTVEYGNPQTERQMLHDLSPIHKIDRVKAPTIVLHGANDTNVPVVEAEQVVDNLKKRGIPVQYVLFPDEGHGFRKTPNRIRSTAETVQWFEKYLK
jgi:dipeptidyl aminopeptidase/acylaminoacyl peptidase